MAGSSLAASERVRARTLVAHDGAVWIWPGIALTVRRGVEIVPVADSAVRFWIAFLHGPETLHRELTWAISHAAGCLSKGDEITAQRTLDSLDLTAVSRGGAAFITAVAEEAGAHIPDMVVSQCATGEASDAASGVLRFAQLCVSHRLIKAGPWDPSKHPRWPPGAPDSQGGRFAPSNSSGASSPTSEPPPELPPLTVYAHKRPGIGHNQGPPLEEPPEIPQEPLSGKARTAFIRLATRWLINALAISMPDAEAFILLLQASSWIVEQCLPYIEAYFTPPKTLSELQRDANFPAKGYEIHHNAEKAQAAADGIPEGVWDASANKIRVPTLKHWEITRWYMTRNEAYGGLSPRAYLRRKSWSEKVRTGHEALVKFGVLKP